MEPAIRDAALIGAAQKVEHCEIAGYGTVREWAEQLGFDEAADLLQQTLDEEKATDQKLTELAREQVNQEAGEGDVENEEMAHTAGNGRRGQNRNNENG